MLCSGLPCPKQYTTLESCAVCKHAVAKGSVLTAAPKQYSSAERYHAAKDWSRRRGGDDAGNGVHDGVL